MIEVEGENSDAEYDPYDPEFDDDLITVLEEMPTWQPAILNDRPVAKKMKQSFVIE